MSDVGDLVVKFSADLSNLNSGITNAKEQITSVGNATEEAAAKVAASSSEIEGSMAGVAESSERASGGFLSGIGNMAGGLLEFGQKLGMTIFSMQALSQMAGNMAQGLLGPAISAETVTTALTTLDGSAAAAAQEMDQLNQFAAKTPFKTLDIDTAAETLQGFGIAAGDVIPEITAIGDALGSVGKSTPAEMQSVVDIFGKINTEGKVTQMTMNELAVHGINGWKALADATGKTIPQVKDMVKSGLLPASDAIKDLTKGIEMNPLYKGGMAKAAGTFTGLLSTLQSNWDQVTAAFGTPIIKSLEGSLNNLGATLASPGFQDFAGKVGQGLVSTFHNIGDAVGKVSDFFGKIDVSGLVASFGHLGDSLGKMGDQILPPIKSFGDWLVKSGTLKNALNGVTTVLSTLVDDISKVVNAGVGMVNFFKNNQVAGDALTATLITAGGVILALAITSIPPLVAAFSAWAIGATAAAAATLAATWPILAVGALIALVITGIILAVQHWGQIVDWLKGVWGNISNWFMDHIIHPIGDAFDGLKKLIGNIWDGIWSGIKNAINWVIGGINNFISGIDAIHIDMGPIHVGVNIPKIPLLASGGFVPAGGMAIAGEAGPELVMGGSGGATVLSNSASRGALGGGATHVHVYLDGVEMTNQLGHNIVSMARTHGGIGALL